MTARAPSRRALLLAAAGWPLAAHDARAAKPGRQPRPPKDDTDAPVWRQIRGVLRYERQGTLATRAEGPFRYQLELQFEQLMGMVPPDHPGGLPGYYLPDDWTISSRLQATVSMSASANVVDPNSPPFIASVSVRGSTQDPAQAHLKSVRPFAPLSEEMSAELAIRLKLSGSATSNLPRIEGMPREAVVMNWPSCVTYDPEDGFLSEGPLIVFPPLGERPRDRTQAMLWDVAHAATDLSGMPTVGGLVAPGGAARTEGRGENWRLRYQQSAEVPVLSLGGRYQVNASLSLEPVPLSLPLPTRTPA